MTISNRSRMLRWMAPAGVAAAIAAAAFTTKVASATGAPKLPARTPAQLIAAVQDADPKGMSGTIVATSKLGLPDLGGAIDQASGGGASLSLQSLASGSHTIRFWYAGEERQRVAVLGDLSESAVVHNGSDVWTYTSTTRRVTHSVVQQPKNMRDAAKAAVGSTPQALAEQALAAVEPTTAVEVGDSTRVADRAAYQLLVKPRDDRSLVGSVRIAIDAETSVPLRFQVFARSATKPAIEVGFTDVSFQVPDASVFTFVPPAGTTVTEESLGSTVLQGGPPGAFAMEVPEAAKGEPGGPAQPRASDGDPIVLGQGWTSVAVLPAGTAMSGPGGDLLQRISEPATGGRIITSALLSVFIADDGKVYAGAITGSDLQTVAATGRGL